MNNSKARVLVIAEAGVNHNGDIKKALALIDVAADAGADVVKFQTFIPEEVISEAAPKAEYQMRTTDAGQSQLEMARGLKLSDEEHHQLVAHCAKRGIRFLSTPFDRFSLQFLVRELKVDCLKIPSGEITNAPLLLDAARSGLPIILSTGMCTLDDIRDALGVLAFGWIGSGEPSRAAFAAAFATDAGRRAVAEKLTLLHCTTEYPTPYEDVNLRAMSTLAQAFGIPVGLSDHTPGVAVSLAGVALGATVIEKHFTLDRSLPGPDHLASLAPEELKALVEGVRQVEAAMGSERKEPAPSEIKNMVIARKSLVARRAIKAGEVFAADDLAVKRPGSGVSSMRLWDYLGRPANRDYAADELIDDLGGV